MFDEEVEERFIKNYPQFCCNEKPLSPFWDIWEVGTEFGYNQCKDKFDIAIEIIEQMKDLFFDCWQERGLNAIKFEQKVNDFLKENK